MRTVRGAMVALLLLLLAGCTAIPVAGSVQQGSTSQPNNPNPVILPSGPGNGASKQSIVKGFVYAQIAGGRYTVAKQYLTSDFAGRWKPEARVLVHDRSWTTTETGDGGVELQVPTAAKIDEAGIYTLSTRTLSLDFRLQKVNGQWRIAGGPNGIVLPQAGFQRNFVSESVQYFDPVWGRLVPDLRWFPLGPSPGRIIASLLTPLTSGSPLDGVVSTSFPVGSRLTAPVSTSAGVTIVRIAVPGPAPSAQATDRMQQQIAGSLAISPSNVRLVVNDTAAPLAKLLPTNAINTSPVVLASGRFGSLTSSGVSEDAVLGRRVLAAKPTAITVATRPRVAALLAPSGVEVVDAKATRVVDSRPGLIAPTLDQRGWTYSVPRDDPGGLRATPAKGSPVQLQAPLRGTEVVAIEASFDGTRMLVLVQTPTGPVAYVAGIERKPDGTPTGLTKAEYPVSLTPDEPVDATWIDNKSIAVLTSGSVTSGSDQQNVVKQQLGGLSTDLGRLAGAIAIVGTTNSEEPLRALTADSGDLYVLSDQVWQAAAADPVKVSVLAVQR